MSKVIFGIGNLDLIGILIFGFGIYIGRRRYA